MILEMEPNASQEDVEFVIKRAQGLGLTVHVSRQGERTVISVFGNTRGLDPTALAGLRGVRGLRQLSRPFRLASREYKPEPTLVRVGDCTVGGKAVVVMAGPCSVESYDQLRRTAEAVQEAGAAILRGGAFKPRSSPYSWQGLAERGLEILARVREETGLLVLTEVLAPEQVALVSRYADILQIGTRNMQNFPLLHAVGESGKPAVLKRGMMSTVEEWLLSAEYILSHGNEKLILCERGIRTFETYTRNTLDINAVPLLKELTHLPVIVDPSHATGKASLVPAVSLAAVAAGADGLLVEVHPDPERAASDGFQSLSLEQFRGTMEQLRLVARSVGRAMDARAPRGDHD